jgi:hypothetical protein
VVLRLSVTYVCALFSSCVVVTGGDNPVHTELSRFLN